MSVSGLQYNIILLLLQPCQHLRFRCWWLFTTEFTHKLNCNQDCQLKEMLYHSIINCWNIHTCIYKVRIYATDVLVPLNLFFVIVLYPYLQSTPLQYYIATVNLSYIRYSIAVYKTVDRKNFILKFCCNVENAIGKTIIRYINQYYSYLHGRPLEKYGKQNLMCDICTYNFRCANFHATIIFS